MKSRVMASVAVILTLSASIILAEEYKYRFTTGSSSTTTFWSTSQQQSSITRVYQDGDEIHTTQYSGNSASYFHLQDPTKHRDIIATRDSLTIHITGTDKQKTIDTYASLDGCPWFQSMSYSLSQFSLSPRNEVVFWIMRTDNLGMHKMRAYKDEIQEIVADGKIFHAQRIVVSPIGFWRHFWCCSYWFRATDGLFLRYEGTNGPPGTPKTTIELIN